MDWLSNKAIRNHHSNATRQMVRHYRDKWDHKPSTQELDILQENLRSYLLCLDESDSTDHRKIIEGILAKPEFLDRAIIVTDGSYLAVRVYAYTVNGNVRILLDTEYEEAKSNPIIREYLWDRKHSVEETLEWVLKNYQTIPFQCGTLSQLREYERVCNASKDNHHWYWG